MVVELGPEEDGSGLLRDCLNFLWFPLGEGGTRPITIDHGLSWVWSSVCWKQCHWFFNSNRVRGLRELSSLLLTMTSSMLPLLDDDLSSADCLSSEMLWAKSAKGHQFGHIHTHFGNMCYGAVSLGSLHSVSALEEIWVKLWREELCPWRGDSIATKGRCPQILGVSD